MILTKKFVHFLFYKKQVTDRRTIHPTDHPTDTPSCRVARTHLKIKFDVIVLHENTEDAFTSAASARAAAAQDAIANIAAMTTPYHPYIS